MKSLLEIKDELSAYYNSLGEGDNITVTGDLLQALQDTIEFLERLE